MKSHEKSEEALRKANENRIYIAEHFYTRPEIHDLVDRAVGPIHSKLNDIGEDVSYLVRKKNQE